LKSLDASSSGTRNSSGEQGKDPINLWEVRRWALRAGVSRAVFLSAYRSSLQLSIARLVQALYRERLCSARVSSGSSFGVSMVLGRPESLWIPIVPKPFVRLDVRVWPCCYRPDRRPVQWGGTFLRELATLLRHSPVAGRFTELSEDFQNSLSNLVLNRLLAGRRGVMRHALEPAYQGHHYYPFPGLRTGPSVDQVVSCSHLNAGLVAVPLVEVSALTFRSPVFSSARECFDAWAGRRLDSTHPVIPVHPWQLELSPVFSAIVSARGACVSKGHVNCLPLASQRTLRVQATSYDLKLSVDAALTSEHRLLFRLNCENAPMVSALVQRLIPSEAERRDLDIQADVASLSFADPGLAPHLSAIVRAPVRTGKGESAVPAIELWTGREIALRLLRRSKPQDVRRFFRHYCQIVMRGPVRFLLEFGLAFEPHLQNSIIVFRERKPHRLIIRDLDGTVMDRERVEALLARYGLKLAADTWDHMPASSVGEDRLIHSLFFGHLGVAVDFLSEKFAVSQPELMHILSEEWANLREAVRRVKGAATRFDSLCEHLAKGKLMLVARLERSHQMRFVRLPKHAAFLGLQV
jgi:hypothetical protein